MQGAYDEWENEDWLHSAKKLIQWTSETPVKSRVMLLVRHSHREVIEDNIDQLSTELTPLGFRMSTEMGKRLPTNRRTWFYFSFVTRCYQTADQMSKGILERGGIVEDMDALEVLVAPEVSDDRFWTALQPDGENITDFVNMWVEGEFGDMVEPFENYKERFLNDTIRKLQSSSDGSLHIHITHDLAMMAAKSILFGRLVEVSDREPFLGGIGVMMRNGKGSLYSSGKIYSLENFLE